MKVIYMADFSIAILILLKLTVPVSMHFCPGIEGKSVCCDGYKLNPEQNNCTRCDRGFRGKNCETRCQYPTYGEVCQSICDCNKTSCDHANGCTQSSGGHFSKRQNSRTVTEDLIDKVNIKKVTSRVMANDTTSVHKTKKTQSIRITTLKSVLIGLAALSIILIMMYLYTRIMEKHIVNTNTV